MQTEVVSNTPPGTVAAPGTVSTNIAPGTLSLDGGGYRAEDAKAPEPEKSLRDIIREEVNRAEEPAEDPDEVKEDPKAEEKAEEKPEEKEEKPKAKEPKAKEPAPKEAAEKGEPDKATEQESPRERSSEGRQRLEAPARFQPKAREKWVDAPVPVKYEVHRIVSEYENELTEYRQKSETLRPYEEMARAAGTTVDKALQHYVGIEKLLSQDFGKGIAQIAQNAGLTPQQTIGHVLRAFGADPARVAQMFQQQPQAFAAPQPKAPPPPNPEVVALRQQVAQLQHQAQAATLMPVVTAWAADKSDYKLLESDIARILGSGMIEQAYGKGLSPTDRLDVAYEMARSLRGLPVSRATQEQSEKLSAPETSEDVGRKAVRSTSAGFTRPASDDTDDIREIARRELRKHSR